MRVALIIERIEPWRGGAETSTMQFANYLARGGCQVHLITATNAPSTPELTLVPIKCWAPLRSGQTPLFVKRAAQYVRAHPFDIVHSITPCPAADVYQPRGGTIPEMLERNVAIRQSPLQRGLKRLGQAMNSKYRRLGRLEHQLLTRRPPPWVIAISQYVTDQLRRHYHFPAERVREIFNGVDPDTTPSEQRIGSRGEIRKRLGLASDTLMYLCVAHNFKLKGVGPLIQAMQRMRAMGSGSNGAIASAKVVIVGRDNPAPFVQLAEKLGVGEQVLFVGATQQMSGFFHAADVLVHPTYYDPCSRVVLEAMAAGLPVITTRYNGAAERIEDGRHGYVIDSPEQVDALAERMVLLADREHRLACGQAGPQAVGQCSMKQHADAVMRLYREILAGR